MIIKMISLLEGGFSETTAGDLTKQISNTSFYLLMLVNGLSTIQSSSQKFSELTGGISQIFYNVVRYPLICLCSVGLTPRVAQLIERSEEVNCEEKRQKERVREACSICSLVCLREMSIESEYA